MASRNDTHHAPQASASTRAARTSRKTTTASAAATETAPRNNSKARSADEGVARATMASKTAEPQVEQSAAAATIRDERLGGDPRVTSMGTIALQSGQTRLVVALLKDGQQLQLKVQQMRPAMFELGTTGGECSKYVDEQRRLMASLSRLKQGPADAWMDRYERLRAGSAGRLLVERQERATGSGPRAPVYRCMLENLRACWRALLNQLDIRSQLLSESTQFFAACRQVEEATDEAEQFVQRARAELMQPDSAGGGQVERFREARRELARLNGQVKLLHSAAQRQQQRLVALIGAISAGNLADSRVDLLLGDGQTLVAFIMGYLGALERRRLSLEGVLSSTNADAHSISRQLTNRWLTNRQEEMATTTTTTTTSNSEENNPKPSVREINSLADLELMESWLALKVEQLNSSLLSSLGTCAADSKSILSRHEQILLECRTVEEASLQFAGRSIHAIKPNEPPPPRPTGSGSTQPEQERELLERQRALAAGAADVITILEARLVLLRRTIDFYGKAREASADLGRLSNRLQVDNSLQSVQFVTSELELKDVSSVIASGATILSELQQLQLAQKHGQRPRVVKLALVNAGIRSLIDQVSQQLGQLKTQLSQRRLVLMNEDATKMAHNFANKCHQLQFWLRNHLLDFLLNNERLPLANERQLAELVERHEQARQQVHNKTAEVEALLRSLPTLAANFEGRPGELAEDIQTASDELRRTWIQTTGALEARLEFAAHYAAILAAAKPIGDQLDGQQRRPEMELELLNQLETQVDELALEAANRATELQLHSAAGSRGGQVSDLNKQQVLGHARGLLMQLQKRQFALNKDRLMGRDRRDTGAGVAAREAHLAATPPRLLFPLQDQQVEPFGSVQLECETEPDGGECRAEWFMGALGRPIGQQVRHSSHSDGRRHLLTIEHLSPQSCGNYFVRLTNAAGGQTVSQCRLKLAGIMEQRRQQQTGDATATKTTNSMASLWSAGAASNERDNTPAISRIIRGVDSRTGEQTPADGSQSARLGSTSETETNATSSNSRNQAAARADRCKQPAAIRVESAASLASSSAGPRSSSRSMSSSPFVVGTPQPPVFVEGLRDSFAGTCCSRAGLVCLVVGNPPPTIEWLHDDQLIASTRCPPTPNKQPPTKTANLCKLTVETLTPSSQGQYVCRASNRLGHTTTALTLPQK